MALTDNQKKLIQAVSQNDIQLAKKCAIACVVEDTTQKNHYFCSKYKSVLESSGSNLIELPHDLKSILCVEDVSNSFREGRYYLSDREHEVFDNIMRMKKVNEKLMELGIPYLNSTLLYGESGTGKTTFGRYVAYKTGLPFCYLNFSNIVDSYMEIHQKISARHLTMQFQTHAYLCLMKWIVSALDGRIAVQAVVQAEKWQE